MMSEQLEAQAGADVFESLANLHLDLRNPRTPDEVFETEDEVLDYLVDHADVEELIQSILSSGWLDYEPLIVLSSDNVVLEGNRRLAALRIHTDLDLRSRLKIDLGENLEKNAIPAAIRIRRVPTRSAARDFIGYKHINGPFKWDALSKAKYATDWHEDGGEIRQISRRLGDSHNTVVRLVNGWRILKQSQKVGFDMAQTTGKSFPFSHLYTAISRPNVRRCLGLQVDDIAKALQPDPVPKEKHESLLEFMSWLYGQRKEPSVIRSQNPDLNKLVEVLGNSTTRTMLEGNRDLDAAYGEVEDKSLRFSTTLMTTIKHAEDTLRLVGNYDGRGDLMSAGDNLRRSVLLLHGAMRRGKEIAEAGDDSDVD